MVTAVIQARVKSTRLPGKILMPIEARPMLAHVAARVAAATDIDQVVLATSTTDADDAVEQFANANGILCYRGSEEDVLDRYVGAVSQFGGDVVVRVTADCPLIAPSVIEKAVRSFRSAGLDYLQSSQPEGMDVEVFTRQALLLAWHGAKQPLDREHVTSFLRLSGKFRTASIGTDQDLLWINNQWSVDTMEDLQFVRAIFRELYPRSATFELLDILQLLRKEPKLMTINAREVKNEGYYQTMAKSADNIPETPRLLEKSYSLKKKAERLIPSCSQTFSKGPSQFVQGVAPVFLQRGVGCHVFDVDGNEYIDYSMALGAVILGHNFPEVTEAVIAAASQGVSFSQPHPLEVEVAELLVNTVPCAEMVRFGKNGSDVTSAAVRLARAITGRNKIVCCGYHGWQDWYIGTTTRNLGVPPETRALTLSFAYNDSKSLKELFAAHEGQIAALILEAVGVVDPEPGFLQNVRELAHQNGALLIFDEVVTGFRLSPGGAQQHFGVVPDLAAIGKAMGNGFSVSALVGPRDYMKVCDEIFFSTTFGGEVVGLAAAHKTVQLLQDGAMLDRIWQQGRKLKDGYNTLAKMHGVSRFTECIGLPPRTVVAFKDDAGQESLLMKSYFQQECLKRGVLFTGGQNLSYSHSDQDIDSTLRVFNTVMQLFRDAVESNQVQARLEGPPVQPVFRKP